MREGGSWYKPIFRSLVLKQLHSWVTFCLDETNKHADPDKLVNAAKGSSNSLAIKKKDDS